MSALPGYTCSPASARSEAGSSLCGRRVVIKLGGAAMEQPAMLDGWASAVARLTGLGVVPIVVHGGGAALTRMLARVGIESRFHRGHRITSPAAAEIAEMVLSGSTHRSVTSALGRAGVDAVGLAGGDARVLEVEPFRPGGSDLGRVGRITAVREEPLVRLLASGFVPVLSSTVRNEQGRPYNVNADAVAGSVAAALAVDVLLFLSDVPAVRNEHGEPLGTLAPGEALALIRAGVADGGMQPKLEAAACAVRDGVPLAVLADGRDPAVWTGALSGGDVACTRILSDRPGYAAKGTS